MFQNRGEKYSRVLMGSERASKIISEIERLRDIENRSKENFINLKESIKFQGSSDYEMKKALIYRNNVLNEMKDLPEEFNSLYEEFKKIKNPIEFYEKMQSSRMLQNFFEWYKDPTLFANFQSNEEIIEYINNELKAGEQNM